MVKMPAALARAGLPHVRMLLQVHDELVFEVPQGEEERAAEVIRETMAHAAEPVVTLDVPLAVEVGWGANWGVAH
jgi:DNA polymerase-1